MSFWNPPSGLLVLGAYSLSSGLTPAPEPSGLTASCSETWPYTTVDWQQPHETETGCEPGQGPAPSTNIPTVVSLPQQKKTMAPTFGASLERIALVMRGEYAARPYKMSLI